MSLNFQMDLAFTRRDILEKIMEDDEEGSNIINSFLSNITKVLNPIATKAKTEIDMRKVYTFKANFKQRWLKAYRCKKRFLTSNESWLDIHITLFKIPAPQSKSSPKASTSFDVNQSEVTKRRKTLELRKKYSCDELTYAAQMKLRQEGKLTASKLMKEINFTSPMRPERIQRKLDSPTSTTVDPHEALAMMINLRMSKRSYFYMYNLQRRHKSKLLPKYQQVAAVKQECYPPGVSITDMTMCVSLQELCNHTAKQLIVMAQHEIHEIRADMDGEATMTCNILYKYGSDGSGSHSRYALPIHDELNEDSDETHVFATYICPIRVSIVGRDEVLWQNPAPSSPIYCRPVRLEFAKESDNIITQEFERMAEEIERMQPTIMEGLSIEHQFIPTMVDGKVVQTLSETTSSSVCYLCVPPTNPSDMNNLTSIGKKSVAVKMLQYGISPLHLYLNCLDCILHIAYRLEVRVWRVTEPYRARVEARKRAIQKALKEKLSLNVDMPTQGKGNTNTGV